MSIEQQPQGEVDMSAAELDRTPNQETESKELSDFERKKLEIVFKDSHEKLMEKHVKLPEDRIEKQGEKAQAEAREEYDFLIGEGFIKEPSVKSVESGPTPEEEAVDEATELLERYIIGRQFAAAKENKRLDNGLTWIKLLLKKEQGKSKSTNPNMSPNAKLIEDYTKAVKEIEKQKKQLPESNPDAYYAVHALDFRKNIRAAANGEMVETPYVRETKEHILKNLEKGAPQFIHGELGGGKTEISLQTARDFLIERQAQKDAEAADKAHFQANPNRSPRDKMEVYVKTFNKAKKAIVVI